ncbi:C1-like protein [Tanacetum coccineum]|uniref:C1-like protein n=1 Tax=Tanacetum coccineum TaxID=301880 RepID=A0ABQ5BKM4_9ASTR
MEEIQHFGHEDHVLKLVDWKTDVATIGGDDDEKPQCYICEEPLSNGDSAYACIECPFFLHKSCSQLPKTINYPFLYQHPLTLVMLKRLGSHFLVCDVCYQRLAKGFIYSYYMPDEGGFTLCGNCFLVEFSREAEVDAIKEAAAFKLNHESHPHHTLTLKSRPASFCCDACKTEEKDLNYECDSCDFWIHKTCASLPPTINLSRHHPKHPLVLVYSLPEKFYKYSYFAHIKCALNAQQPPSTQRDDPGTSAASEDVNNLLHFPMSEAFTDPLKQLHFEKLALHDDETNEINHWNHPDHPLILNVEESESNNMMPNINSSDPIKVCYACVRPLSFPYYSCKDGCSFTDLHQYCAHLPLTSAHQLHPDHTLHLVDTWEETFYECIGCSSFGNTFAYKCESNCKFYLCVNCESLPTTIKHKSHNHPLIQVIDPKTLCKACDRWSQRMSYACKACEFQLDMYCAIRSPVSLSHRYCKGQEILLTYPPVENHPEDFYCDICEEEMDPRIFQKLIWQAFPFKFSI